MIENTAKAEKKIIRNYLGLIIKTNYKNIEIKLEI